MTEINSCTCNRCTGACKARPGWFSPDQVNDLLKFFNVEKVEDLFEKGVVIDWYQSDTDILLLAPNILGNEGSKSYPSNPLGTCVFLDENDRCKIYDVRPKECALYNHEDQKTETESRHAEIAKEWEGLDILENHRNSINTSSPGFGGMLPFFNFFPF